MGIAFFFLGVYPGSKYTVMASDLRALYLPLYGYISDSGPGFNNLFHSMSGGLGGNIYATIILCISPLDAVYTFVPLRYLPTALYFMILFKIGLCGLSFCFYLRRNEKEKITGPMAVLFSCCYALMSYNIMYYLAPMWYDCVILLPLMALALEKIIKGKKSPAFIILTALCLIDDYYIAYMAVIALVIYFVFRSAEEKPGLREFLKRTLRFAVHGLISSGIAMIVILPAVMDFARGKLAEGESAATGMMIKNSLRDILLSFKCGSYAGFDFNASPNIFCGSLCVILALVWFIYGKRNIGARIAGLLLTAFYFVSFIWGPLDRAWHGFREPICFSVRYAFTFSFFVILFAIRGYAKVRDLKIKMPALCRSLIALIVCVLTLSELYLNAGSILGRIGSEAYFTTAEEYYGYVDLYERLLSADELESDGSYGRIANTDAFSGDDGFLFGFDGLARFSSSYNFRISKLFRDLGIAAHNHGIGEKGITQPTLGIFDTGYIISKDSALSDYYEPVTEYNGYYLYKNDHALPFAYAVTSADLTAEFGTDPFMNLNTVYGEFFGPDKPAIYTEVPRTLTDEETELGDGVDSLENYVFTAEKSGHYFLSVEFKNEVLLAEEIRDENGNFKPYKIIRDYILDGEKGEYGNGQYSYCTDLGYLEEGSRHILTLLSSNDEIGESRVYYYNDDVYEKIVSDVTGFGIKEIGRKGIVLSGTASEDTDVIVTLPYEDGYSVYVDGVKTSYCSYRDTLMKIHVGPGTHEITIGYFPPGLKAGILISLISVIISVLYLYAGRKSSLRPAET